MSGYCASNSNATNLVCPECGTACKPVKMRTLYHQVKFPENQAIVSDNYYFCPNKGCDIAYFSSAGNKIPKKHLISCLDIQKEKLCYCFDIDTAVYVTAFNTNNAEPIKNFVIQRTKSGDCACEERNPSGQCYLTKFKHLDKGSSE